MTAYSEGQVVPGPRFWRNDFSKRVKANFTRAGSSLMGDYSRETPISTRVSSMFA